MNNSYKVAELEEAVLKYGSMVTAICNRMLNDKELAKDAAQEAWIEITKGLSSFRGQSKLSTWIYTVTTRAVTKYLNKEKYYTVKFMKSYSHGEEFVPPNIIDFDENLWVKETCDKCLTAILNCLDIEMRLIYIFRDIAELPYDEIAKVMNKDENNIRKIISRARKRLRNFLNDECALVCTSTQCKCRMKSWVEKVNLKDEYNKIRASVSRINLYKASQKVLPQKNYWKELIK